MVLIMSADNEIIITKVDIELIRLLMHNKNLVKDIEQKPNSPLNNLIKDLRKKAIILKKRGDL